MHREYSTVSSVPSVVVARGIQLWNKSGLLKSWSPTVFTKRWQGTCVSRTSECFNQYSQGQVLKLENYMLLPCQHERQAQKSPKQLWQLLASPQHKGNRCLHPQALQGYCTSSQMQILFNRFAVSNLLQACSWLIRMASGANTDPAPHPPWTHQLQHHPWRALYSAAPSSCDRTGADKPGRASSPSGQTACTLRSGGRNVPLPGRETNQQYSESIPDLPEHFQLIHRHLHHAHCDNGLHRGPRPEQVQQIQQQLMCWGAVLPQPVLLKNLEPHRAQWVESLWKVSASPLVLPKTHLYFPGPYSHLVWNTSLC